VYVTKITVEGGGLKGRLEDEVSWGRRDGEGDGGWGFCGGLWVFFCFFGFGCLGGVLGLCVGAIALCLQDHTSGGGTEHRDGGEISSERKNLGRE